MMNGRTTDHVPFQLGVVVRLVEAAEQDAFVILRCVNDIFDRAKRLFVMRGWYEAKEFQRMGHLQQAALLLLKRCLYLNTDDARRNAGL